MFIFEKLKSHSKLPWSYCRVAFTILRSNWKPILIFIGIFALCSYLIGFLLTFLLFLSYFLYNVYHLCDQLLYNPECPKDSRTKVLTPKSYGFHNFETHFITTDDNVRIHAILLKRPSLEESLSSPTLIYFHGNAGNIGHRLVNAIECMNKLKCNVLLVEYRGFGLSKGRPSESGLYKDAYAALKFLYGRNDICTSKIVLFGRSLGGAVAIGVAHLLMTSSNLQNYRPAALIIENTFTSIPDISRQLCAGRSRSCFARFFRLIPNWFYKNRYDSHGKVSKILLPTLFISGLADELIPSDMMTKLFNCSSANYKEMHKFEGGNHNFTWKCAQYYTTMDSFLCTIFHPSHFTEEPHTQTEPLADEKFPLISSEEFRFPPGSVPAPAKLGNSVVMYHSQEATCVSESSLANPNYEETSGQVLQLLDSGYTPVMIAIDGNKYAELVDI